MIGTSRLGLGLAYLILSGVDIFAIYKEIQAVVFRVMNHERAVLLAQSYVMSSGDPLHQTVLPSPQEVASVEHIFLPPKVKISDSFVTVPETCHNPSQLRTLAEIFKDDNYLLCMKRDKSSASSAAQAAVVLHQEATSLDLLRALLAVETLRFRLGTSTDTNAENMGQEAIFSQAKSVKEFVESNFDSFVQAMANAGWDTKRFMFKDIKHRTQW
eukprot:CAMPEP_0113949764 /NCGR_PEP_ID=MMETSP1339-20121228/77399_1 /TAXON_ID=94617 /ORGANISM="Fibrocapsa japonica" /LENGTH=213 /DNA_ID=CAMNT_0000957351 /DNA_START=60 /DNA_END=698 /DNA_ORIENTATION=- /assembly_acc=CAM_ASM_000762